VADEFILARIGLSVRGEETFTRTDDISMT
jgi:hypothetical protein